MRAQKTKTEVRQEQIAQAALDIIGAEGIHALSIAGIAQRVGIVPSAVYRHYAGKDEILDAVLDLLGKRLRANVAAAREERPDALGRLKALVSMQSRLLAANRAIPHVVFSDGIYAGHPARKERLRDHIGRYLADIEGFVRDGQREGTVQTGIPPQTAAVMFLGMVLPAALIWTLTEGAFDTIGHVERVWPLFERGVSPRD